MLGTIALGTIALGTKEPSLEFKLQAGLFFYGLFLLAVLVFNEFNSKTLDRTNSVLTCRK